MLSEVRSVRPLSLSGRALQPLLFSAWGSGNAEGTPCRRAYRSLLQSSVDWACPPSETSFWHWNTVHVQVPFFSFSCLSPFISSWQGLEWGQSKGSALLGYYYHVQRFLRVCLSTPPPLHPHATSWTTCPIPSATHEPSGRDSPYLLRLCAWAADPAGFCTRPSRCSSSNTRPSPPRSPGGPMPPFLFYNGAVSSRGDAITLWGHRDRIT